MLKASIIPAVLTVFGALFLLACIGEKERNNKILYAVVAVILFVILLIISV